MTRFASSERQGLCDTFEAVGPDAPTLCSPWLSKDLAAHLVVRESRPDVAAGIWIPALAGRLERVQNGYAAWDWPRLVDKVRSGPPRWSLAAVGLLDEAINTSEFFVHHEDVLRARPDWAARELSAAHERSLWAILGRIARVQLAGSAAGVLLVAPAYGQRQVSAEKEIGTVVVTGKPSELLLYAFGRRDVAQVDVSGDVDAIAAIQRTSS